MSTTAVQEAAIYQPCELGRYAVGGEVRVLVGRMIEGKLHVFDQPDDRQGRRYFVEADFESDQELAVLLSHYRRHAERLGVCPMSREVSLDDWRNAAAEPPPPDGGTP